ncbi:hypothetical protein K32_24360 [Kaistia sp. 32K]|uniref:hypothetical protein n=1 Tax=Kaistia sp. 32K TaxID=2795690 RepID=UPI0019154895|nr:hypothetical protein [Kaistia sp. 32K]BCP53819.1 hypothetical protein K32_24360 [Kaistia sp. 32K]
MTVVASKFERVANELYETEPWATEALLRHFPVEPNDRIWEPAAGNHKIADVLRAHGAEVFTSDIAVYDRPHDWVRDFFAPFVPVPPGITRLYTNPPYGKQNRDAVRFARISLERCSGLVALLLTAKFDFGKTRVDLFRDNPRYVAKIALVDRIQWFPGDKGGTEDHAWYVWAPAPGPGRGLARLIYEGRP